MAKIQFPAPEGFAVEDEIVLENGKYAIQKLHKTEENEGWSTHWRALRYGEPWPACPFPDWAPDNLTAALFNALAEAEANAEASWDD